MAVYLVRHGEAASEAEDPARPLTARGREAVERVARHAAGCRLPVTAIRHSGLLRARQTAEIFGAYLRPPGGVEAVAGLRPNDDPEAAAALCEGSPEGLMLVGHLPHLGRLAARLVLGRGGRELLRLEPAAVAVLERGETGWVVAGLWGPEVTGPR